MTAYYNEIDPKVVEWLRNLIAAGLIAPGDVDNRSIEDVRPDDLRGYTQCHFFAGIGVWSYALRRAGWPDDRPVWTGSCPCQPFSAAGKGGGFDDERHLWPAWEWLIARAKPRSVPVFGEQVASKAGLAWLDIVSADLEGQGYTVRAADLCAAGVGAPHIRQRLFFVADAGGARAGRDAGAASCAETRGGSARRTDGQFGRDAPVADGAACVALGDADDARSQRRCVSGAVDERHGAGERAARAAGPADDQLAQGLEQRPEHCGPVDSAVEHTVSEREVPLARVCERTQSEPDGTSAVNGFWRDADWLPCIDGKARPVEPGTFPLAHGATGRVVRLRAYGNAIVAPLAEEFIRAYVDIVALSELL